jgi:hypothetical protein
MFISIVDIQLSFLAMALSGVGIKVKWLQKIMKEHFTLVPSSGRGCGNCYTLNVQ